MNIKHISLVFAAVVALLSGCAKSPIQEPSDGQFTNLELSYVGTTETKAAIDGTTFPEEGEIGLFLFKDETATQDYGDGYKNIKYTYNSSKSKWTASPSIKVGSTQGYLYGYYPYKADTQEQPINIKAIPVASSLDGDDVMYASKQNSPITDQTASQTAITMNHALARVCITVVNKGYTGNAKLSKIKFSGAETAPEGTLNALDGSVTATKSEVTLDVTGDNQTITAAGTTYECLLVPSKAVDGKQTVTLTLTIDGEDKTANLSDSNGVVFAQGTKSNITITLNNTGIIVQTVSIDDWNVVEVGGHKVTVKLSDDVADAGIADNLIVQCKSDGESVIIESYSKNTVKSLVVRINDGSLIAPAENGRINTFAISDITKDITATLAYARKIKVSATFNADFMPNVDEYPEDFDKGKEYLEGRKIVFKVDNVGGYRLDSLVCGQTKVLVDNIELKNISADTEVKAYYTYTDCLDGVFSVSNTTRVRFSRGNLFCVGMDGNYEPAIVSWGFEPNQYASYTTRDVNHISHFLWCKSAEESVKLEYGEEADDDDNLFTNASPTKPKENFAVNGQQGFWRVLSGGDRGEWKYLIDRKDGTLRKFGVKVCGRADCLILLPDDWDESVISLDDFASTTEYNEGTTIKWSTMEAAGAVCLPPAGYRGGDMESISYTGTGFYWTSTNGSNYFFATQLEFYPSGWFSAHQNQMRTHGSLLRLVTDAK